MRSDLTDITLVVDRSGSMQSCRLDAEGGINHFIDEQKAGEGDALFTLVQFDTEYDFVHKGVPIDGVPKYELHPRGSTALLDAVGRAINEAGERLGNMDEASRPGCVVFVIVTDGQENSSKEFAKATIKEMVNRQQDEYNWQFMFLGADASAFAEASEMGISQASTAVYDKTAKSGEAYAATSDSVSRTRSATRRGLPAKAAFSGDERRRMA